MFLSYPLSPKLFVDASLKNVSRVVLYGFYYIFPIFTVTFSQTICLRALRILLRGGKKTRSDLVFTTKIGLSMKTGVCAVEKFMGFSIFKKLNSLIDLGWCLCARLNKTMAICCVWAPWKCQIVFSIPHSTIGYSNAIFTFPQSFNLHP